LHGISLIEALITLLILSIGLLGLGQLQARLWSASGKLHATSNAYLMGATYLEIFSAKQTIAPDLTADPPMKVLRAGTLFNAETSLSDDGQLTKAEIRIEWEDPGGSEIIRLETVADTVSRTSDTRLLLQVN